MDGRILLYPDVLKLCGIELTGNNENDLKVLKGKIKELVDRIKSRDKRSMGFLDKDGNASAKEIVQRKIDNMEKGYETVCQSSNLYECIHFYMQHRYPEMVEEAKIKNTRSSISPEQLNNLDYFIKCCDGIVKQFDTPDDVKKYVEQILPCIGTVDFKNMNLSKVGESEESLSRYVSKYSMNVVMSNEPAEIMSGQVLDQLISVYSFGYFTYNTSTVSEQTPHELLAFVKKNRDGKVDVFTGIMRLGNLTEMVVNKDLVEKINGSAPFGVREGEGFSADIKMKYDGVEFSDDMEKFFLEVVASRAVLVNAKEHNQGFIGDIQKGGKNPKYGEYRLVCDVIGVEELLETLRVANNEPICSKSDGTMSTFPKILDEIQARALELARKMIFENKDNGMEIGD